jgi:conjugal transfer pilus assembly protein TraU
VVHHFLKSINSSINIIRIIKDFVKGIALGITVILLTVKVAEAKCTGRFVNPITDVCWECTFPISIGNAKLFSSDNPGTDNPSLPICACSAPVPRIGIAAGFWEPIRLVDVSKRPFCFPNLGGIEFNPGINAGTGSASKGSSHSTAS